MSDKESDFISEIERASFKNRLVLCFHNSMVTAFIYSEITESGLALRLANSKYWNKEEAIAEFLRSCPNDLELNQISDWFWGCGYEPPMLQLRASNKKPKSED